MKELGLAAAFLKDVVMEEPEPYVSPDTDGLYTVDEELKGLIMANAALAHLVLLNTNLLAKLRSC